MSKVSQYEPIQMRERTFECTDKNTIVENTLQPMAEAIYESLTGMRQDDMSRSIEMDRSACRGGEANWNCNSITSKELKNFVARLVSSLAVCTAHKLPQIDTDETSCYVSKKESDQAVANAKEPYDAIFSFIDSITTGLKTLFSSEKGESCTCVCNK